MTVAVIGGGPAGMSAAISAAEAGAEVVLFEKNEKLGKKLYITGKGRCNVTNSAEGEEFLSKVNTNPKFLYAALSGFSSSDTVRLMESSGVRLRLERGGRYFPVSDKASDVTKALANNMNKAGVKVLLSSEVSAVNICGGRVVSVFSDGKVYPVGALVVATGGVSYPTTGSTGSGAAFAKRAGLSVVPFKPSLCGMITEKVFPLMGLTLKNVNVTLFSGGKEKASEFGELLFTHTGVSGPTILSLSSVACKTAAARSKKQSEKSVGEKASTTAEGEISFGAEDIGEGIFPLENCRISVDLKPALSAEELDARILRDFSQQKNKILRNALSGLLPSAMVPVIIEYAGLDSEVEVNSVTRVERAKLVRALKDFGMSVKGLEPIESAIVSSGGVSVGEINASTMAAKKIPNLFFAGETIDVDAMTGGFNIQIALSTGRLAGKSAAKLVGKEDGDSE